MSQKADRLVVSALDCTNLRLTGRSKVMRRPELGGGVFDWSEEMADFIDLAHVFIAGTDIELLRTIQYHQGVE